ncbi:MAG: hypothetical protein JNL82_40530 [Myxococcales bacterium]|nr:hypothetical protein [Myxococcales bacterium]
MASGITQSFFLRQFIEEVVRTGGAALAGSGPPPTREGLEREFTAAALAAATSLFGAATPIAVALTEELGDVRFFQELAVVEAVTDPRTQVALGVLAAAELKGAAIGDTVAIPILYTANPHERDAIAARDLNLGPHLPLPVHSEELWVRLTAALNAALLRWFPAPLFPEDTLGSLLAGGGGWTRGLSARAGDVEVEITGAFLDFYRTHVTSGWFEYGFEVEIRKAGVAVFNNDRRRPHVVARLGAGDDAPHLTAPCRGDNEGNVHAWAVLPTGEAARPGLLTALQELADGLAAGEEMRGAVELEALLTAAIRPPVADGLWAWMAEALPRLLGGFAHVVEHEGTAVRVEVAEVFPPGVGLTYFGDAAVRLVGRSTDPELLPNPEGESLQLGGVGPEALTLPGPDAAERRDLEAIVATYREWLAVHLDHHVEDRGLAGIAAFNYYYSFAGYFPLVQLLEQRMRWGPPGEPPVPPFDEAALTRAGKLVEPVEVSGDHVLAAFAVGGWTVVLHDDVEGRPFGSHCGITLVAADGGAPVEVMMVDAWNPETRTVIDGDAFAFRRFVTWLREAILRGGYDELRVFSGADEDEDEDDEEPEDDEDEGDEQADALADGEEGDELWLSDWLLFGLPDAGDRFLVDWRAQWHIVNAVHRVDEFAGIYGFSGATVERLRTRDVVLWRRFLREAIDPRFARTFGERLINLA